MFLNKAPNDRTNKTELKIVCISQRDEMPLRYFGDGEKQRDMYIRT